MSDWRKIAAEGRRLVEEMDLRMPEQATEDEDGWITSYRIPVGPWHRLLAWSRSFSVGESDDAPTVKPDGRCWCGDDHHLLSAPRNEGSAA